MRKPFVVSKNVSEESFDFLNPSLLYLKPAYVFSQEEMFKFLSHIPSFTKREPSVHNMRVFFPVNQWIPVEMDEDPNRSFMVQFLHHTSKMVIARIMHMNYYTAFETTEVVSHPLFFHL